MILLSADDVRRRAESLAERMRSFGAKVSVVEQASRIGGGALPDFELPGAAVRWEPPCPAHEAAKALREQEPPLLARIQEGSILLDPRTLDEGELEAAAAVVGRLV
jgi:L-seryl-tRNA(Ser) seleniumtransferase